MGIECSDDGVCFAVECLAEDSAVARQTRDGAVGSTKDSGGTGKGRRNE